MAANMTRPDPSTTRIVRDAMNGPAHWRVCAVRTVCSFLKLETEASPSHARVSSAHFSVCVSRSPLSLSLSLLLSLSGMTPLAAECLSVRGDYAVTASGGPLCHTNASASDQLAFR